MDEVILQSALPEAPWGDPSFHRLPGMRPVGPDDWLLVDAAHAPQMALRERLLAERRPQVVAMLPEAAEAAAEMLEVLLGTLARRKDYVVGAGAVRRPDGEAVVPDPADPFGTAGRLVQEDICLLERRGAEHALTGAVLCFPSGWTLHEKLGHPLVRIHRPVPVYDEDVSRRVQRLFDGLKPGRPLMRANLLRHRHPALHAPRREGAPKPAGGVRDYLRTERQCLVRLPRTGAVLFTIHTTVVDWATLDAGVRAALHGPD